MIIIIIRLFPLPVFGLPAHALEHDLCGDFLSSNKHPYAIRLTFKRPAVRFLSVFR